MSEPSTSAHADAYLRVDQLLADLVSRTEVRYGMLVDHTGLVLSGQGNTASFLAEEADVRGGSTVESIGTLVANNASANLALAHFLGEETFGEQLLVGKKGTLYVKHVGKNALLTLVFDESVPSSKVKLAAKRAVEGINELLETIKRLPEPTLHEDFAAGASALLDDLLG